MPVCIVDPLEEVDIADTETDLVFRVLQKFVQILYRAAAVMKPRQGINARLCLKLLVVFDQLAFQRLRIRTEYVGDQTNQPEDHKGIDNLKRIVQLCGEGKFRRVVETIKKQVEPQPAQREGIAYLCKFMFVPGKETENEQYDDKVLYADVPAEHNNIKYNPYQNGYIKRAERDDCTSVVGRYENR